ncbi:MAG: hypothetical protein Tp139SUR460282_18 [Prokaryotic dsDNA virus sp.]|jgi:predicted transcriptional regulator|nr:MAG: hypothetical protein Tp139SUR460282_18 [Prokaryotic dsDNA virus sp.]|tara:strand:+ start:8022 stop:8876 length:855 start_codon:yes stop_codon:yes gene_type:complete
MKYNRIYKPKKFDNYTIVPIHIYRHKGISLGATGLYSWMFSHKSDQKITVEFIANHFKEGRDTIRKRLNELIDSGFMIREKITDKGKFKGINYYLNDKPKTEKPEPIKPDTDFSAQSNINNIYNILYKRNINVKNEKIIESYPHFVNLFPNKYQPRTDTQTANWIDCLDKCVRLDKYDLGELYLVVKFTRNNNFWSNNFLSLLKLRNQDQNGIKFIDRFFDNYKKYNKPSCYWKIKNIVEYVIYNDPDGVERLGAKTKTDKLNEYNISQILERHEIETIKNFIR